MIALIKLGLIAASVYSTAVSANYFSKKKEGINRARNLVTDKGILNIGSGCTRSNFSKAFCELPEVVANIDLDVTDNCPNCSYINLEDARLPYSNGQFDVAFASHVLEHLNNWEDNITEWSRVADHVILVLPNPLSVGQMVNPDHKQHFSFNDMQNICNQWKQVEIFS